MKKGGGGGGGGERAVAKGGGEEGVGEGVRIVKFVCLQSIEVVLLIFCSRGCCGLFKGHQEQPTPTLLPLHLEVGKDPI